VLGQTGAIGAGSTGTRLSAGWLHTLAPDGNRTTLARGSSALGALGNKSGTYQVAVKPSSPGSSLRSSNCPQGTATAAAPGQDPSATESEDVTAARFAGPQQIADSARLRLERTSFSSYLPFGFAVRWGRTQLPTAGRVAVDDAPAAHDDRTAAGWIAAAGRWLPRRLAAVRSFDADSCAARRRGARGCRDGGLGGAGRVRGRG